MGNCSSEQQARLFRAANFSNDPSAFRVFVKKRNKFIPGWLKINDDEIVFSRGGNNFQFWPLAHLRRYGYTCSGVFFFESGRRCATGEGLHTFQSHQAERIFHMVQSKIKIEEYARGSRAGSVALGGHAHRVNSLVPIPCSAATRIHPVQRFSSEGSGSTSEFGGAAQTSRGSCAAPPPYSTYTDARRLHANASPNCPSVVSAASAAYACTGALHSRDRPRSVVSNIEHGIVHQHHRMPQPAHPPPPGPIQQNASSATLLQLFQQQQQGGYALPPSHLNALAGSASGSCLMNQSFHSVLDSSSPWPSQQQLEGEIVLEHVLGAENRRRLQRPNEQQQQRFGNCEHLQQQQQHPIRIAVPPPRPMTNGQMQQQQRHYGTVNGTNSGAAAVSGCGGAGDRGDHAYVNVDLRSNGADAEANGLNVRELHRTDRSRLEFLSTGPGAFMLASPTGMHPPPQPMQHSFHQQFYGPASPFQAQQQCPLLMPPPQMMSASLSGALPSAATYGPREQHVNGARTPMFGQHASNSLEHLSSGKIACSAKEGTANGTAGSSNSTLIAASSTTTTTTTSS